MKLPSHTEALKILRKNCEFENIVWHCEKVAEIANFLTEKLAEAGEKVDTALVDRLALLHDVAKSTEIKSGKYRKGIATKLLAKEGYAQLGKMIECVDLTAVIEKKCLKSLEAKIVYLADKRIVEGRVVSLAERFDYFRRRYGRVNKKFMQVIDKCEPLAKKLEGKIFAKLPNVDKEMRSLQ